MSAASADQRIVDLEIRIAHQDRVIAALDDVVREFAARVERLERTLEDVRATAVAGAPAIGPADEPPPHY